LPKKSVFFTQLKKQVVMKKVLRPCEQGSTWAGNRHQGMTLIELLVVITIIGILAAIAFPVLLGQINKAKEVEAIQTVKHLSVRQQEFYLENNQFTDSLNELGIPSVSSVHWDSHPSKPKITAMG
jgi:prepilin-type N-terminal cleavage/methylation domain-containing protein